MATSEIPQDNMAPGPDATGQTTTTGQAGEFGTSEFGERLDYAKPKYQDLWAFILFYVHVLIIIILCIYFWGVTIPELEEETSGSVTVESSEDDGSDTSGVWVTLVVSLFAGALFGMLWLQCMKMFAEMIIKILLFVQIGCWAIVAIMGVAIGEGGEGLIAIGVIFMLITILYTWCVWSRIPFAGACLSIASQIVQTYHGTVWLSLGVVFINFIWCIIWVFAIWAYFVDVALQQREDDPNCAADDSCTSISNLIVFLYLISLYWGLNVWRNVSHTTTCGVAATWYFNPGIIINPSRGAFKRTMTTSFGSVCFGSLLVAILQAIRAMLRLQGKRGCAYCLILCIERIMRYFNKYAFAQVAIYGTTFLQSAKATWELFMNNGLSALINDDLSGLALTCGAVLGGVVSGIVGYLVSQAFYPDNLGYGIALAWAGFILGYYACVILLIVVASGVVAIFVCFAEDPAACASNRPEAFAKLTGVSPAMQEMAQNRGIQGVAPQQQQQMA